MASSTTLRRELLVSFAVLFGGAVLVASVGLFILLPLLESPGQATLFIISLIALDLIVLFLFGHVLLRRTLLRPMDRLVSDSRQIASGDYKHRIGDVETAELAALRESVNAMADRLIHDQSLLAENVGSLERTNIKLIAARDQVVHAARLASIGTLASGIAHEVGNPLAAIVGYVDVARSRLATEGGDPEILDSIREEALRIDRIVRSLLDFARAKAEGPAPHPPQRVVHRVRDLLEAQGKLDGIDARWSIVGDIPLVLMDPMRLEQVLLNLLLNALDAMEGMTGPVVEVTLRFESGPVAYLPIHREGDPPGINYAHRRRSGSVAMSGGGASLAVAERVVVLTVEDNGPGVSPQHLHHLFDPFFTTKEPGKGTGLGLAISAQLVDGMGGRIECVNGPLGGAAFTVQLPAVLEAEVSTSAEDLEESPT